jgi:hypothetical protein
MNTISRGFRGRRRSEAKLPPGQYLESSFPVLQAGPTPPVRTAAWTFTITTETGEIRRWDWKQFTALPSEDITVDIHCVTQWSKLGTNWRGVSLDTLLDGVATEAGYAMARSYGGYTTNLPLPDLRDGKAWVAYSHDGKPARRPVRPARPDRRLVHLDTGLRPPPAAAGGRLGRRPLMSMIRAHGAAKSQLPVGLIYSARSPADVMYAHELSERTVSSPLRLTLLFTRSAHRGVPPGRVSAAVIATSAFPPADDPSVYVCGPTGFVEAAASLLIEAGHRPASIKTERFGATGG